jgi:hypothetical protein
MRPSHVPKQASLGAFWTCVSSALVFVASCATEPPPRPVLLDPANPTAAEAIPLETTNVKPTALEAPPPEPAAPPASPEKAPPKDEGAHQHEHGGGSQ